MRCALHRSGRHVVPVGGCHRRKLGRVCVGEKRPSVLLYLRSHSRHDAGLAYQSGGVMIENIALMLCLMLLGVGVTWALLIGFVYYLEWMND